MRKINLKKKCVENINNVNYDRKQNTRDSRGILISGAKQLVLY